MDVHASLDTVGDPDSLFAEIDDLARYPAWMDLVHDATPLGGDPPAWDTELRARLGPLARSKRLRMERTVHDPAGRVVRFERRQHDGRDHSPWVLDAAVTVIDGDRCRLDVHLHYGGSLWTGGVLERALSEQISEGRARLAALMADRGPTH